MKAMAMWFMIFWGWCKWFATFELAPKNAFLKMPTVTNSKADRELAAPVFLSSIAFFSG